LVFPDNRQPQGAEGGQRPQRVQAYAHLRCVRLLLDHWYVFVSFFVSFKDQNLQSSGDVQQRIEGIIFI
jgi:hypothetical protein